MIDFTSADRAELKREIMALAPDDRVALFRSFTPEEAAVLLHDWRFWARPEQIAPPGRWGAWWLIGGRGSGKTRTGAEWVHAKARENPNGRGFLLGATTGDVKETMIEGESGILATAHPNFMPRYTRYGGGRLVYPNGCRVRAFTAEKPDRMRGPQHAFGWIDEFAAFQYPQEAWDQAQFGLRLGPNPQALITTTPKPIKLLMDVLPHAVGCGTLRALAPDDPQLLDTIAHVVTVMSSYDNRENLSDTWFNRTIAPYIGTRLGDQEIFARLLTEVEGALWSRALIDGNRIGLDPVTLQPPKLPEFVRIIVAVDPAITMKKGSNETGIILAAKGENGHAYILEDVSGKYSPDKWGRHAVTLYHAHQCDRVIAEQNQGGDMVKSTINTIDENVPVKLVTATRGKVVRAEPVAALYEQHKIHHVGTFGALEAQMTTWVPDTGLDSPDRMDALVWAITDLMLGKQGAFVA